MQGRRLTWLVGGVGLIACGVMGTLRWSVQGSPGSSHILAVLTDLLRAAAVLVLAVGLSREGSVVVSKMLGLAAATALALWPLVDTIVNLAATHVGPAEVDAWLFWMYFALLLPGFAGAIAAVQLGRAQI